LAAEEHRATSLCARASDVVVASAATGSAAHEQEDGCEEHSSPGSPCEAECVPADLGCETSVAELIAGFDEDGTVEC